MAESTTQVTVGSILGRSLGVTVKNFLPFLAIAIVFNIPALLVEWFVVPGLSENVGKIVSRISTTVFGGLVTAGILYGVFQSLRGGKVEFGKCLNVALSRLVPVVLISFVYGLAVGLGIILFVIPGIIIACMWYVAIPATVVEKVGVGEALSRSAALTKGHRLTLFLVFLVIFGLMFALGILLLFPLAASGSTILFALITFGLGVTIGLWGSAAQGVAYHDLRAAKEGIWDDDLAEVFS